MRLPEKHRHQRTRSQQYQPEYRQMRPIQVMMRLSAIYEIEIEHIQIRKNAPCKDTPKYQSTILRDNLTLSCRSKQVACGKMCDEHVLF